MLKQWNNYDEALVKIYYEGEFVQENTIETDQNVSIKLDEVHIWSPEKPKFYDVEVIYYEDIVESYFGLRKYSIEKDNKGILRFYLNNEPFYFNGVLDQSYWPEGLLMAPSDEALV